MNPVSEDPGTVQPHLCPAHWYVALEQASQASASQIPPGFEFTVQ